MTGSPTHMSAKDLLSVTLVVVLWGLNFVPTKIALHDFTPFQLGAIRFLLTAFPMVLLIPRPKIPLRWLLIYAATQGLGQFGFLFFAIKLGMTAALASVLMQTQIFFTAMLGAALLGEVIPRSLKIGMMVAAIGLLCFAVNIFSVSNSDSFTVVGFVLTLSAASMWASSNIIVKKLQATGLEYSALSLLVWSCLISGAAFVVMSLVTDDYSDPWRWLHARTISWICMLYLGWVAGGAFWLWTLLLKRHPASRVAPYSLGIPVVGMLVGILVLNEQVSALQWTGSALVMSALVLVVCGSLYSVKRMKRRYRK